MARRVKSEYKPLLFTTTVRNPERFKDFMNILYRYNGQILTNDIITQIEKDIFKVGLYRPTKRIPESVKAKWKTTKNGQFSEYALSDQEAQAVLDNNDSTKWNDIKGHKEAGFDWGWPSRFDTQYKLMQCLGFVKYRMGHHITFSEVGKYLASSTEIKILEDGSIEHGPSSTPHYEQMAFLQAFAKYQRNNPFIRELNDNIPLILLLETIKLINANPEFNQCGIAYHEIPLVIFWKDNNASALSEMIFSLRKQFGYSPSNEVIVHLCTNEILGGFKQFKMKSIVQEYPDEFIRKMRMTGLFTFRGGGRFFDINHIEDAKIDYILTHYSMYRKYDDAEEYFKHMSSIDSELFSKEALPLTKNDAAQKLAQWIKVYDWKSIKTELYHLSKREESKDMVMKFISAPSRLEFLTALAIKSRMPDVRVVPNYCCDDTGLPTSTAGGNKGDIECYERQNGVLVEVTMATGRTQTMMEVWPIERHLDDFQRERKAQCIFVAPSIFSDSQRQIEFVTFQSHGKKKIRAFAIDDLIIFLEHTPSLYDYSITQLEDSPKMVDYADNLMSLNGGISILSLSHSLQEEFGQEYASMGVRQWHNVVRDYVERHTRRYNIPEEEAVQWLMAAESNEFAPMMSTDG